ncbi:MFS transporter [Ruminococcus sp. Marseille-P6503]|uniref:MFS transporter n=1 Tax=Ruminococcus sp. Marseille-P6503 TaxID=2364796 RepID=UPI000F53DDE1|nr:MFS transporter [Ruminococcus sp. Marseille-P6503]
MKFSYSFTRKACYTGYITQAVVNNFAPLLFAVFQKSFDLSVAQIGFLVAYNFAVQAAVDFLAAGFVDKIGVRRCTVFAHFVTSAGLILMGILPFALNNGYAGLLIASTLCAVGGGLIEVLISPIIEALPSGNKSAGMSLLHSFYCWGHAGIILVSTLYFNIFGIENWQYLSFTWAIVPFLNAFAFIRCPLCPLVEEGKAVGIKKLAARKLFMLFLLMMLCSGAAEQAISQWTSYFAQNGLHISKTAGDLIGVCLFALLMGTSRALYVKISEKIPLKKFIALCALLCMSGYLAAVFSPVPVLSLIACGICGFSVGIMWPGVYSLTAQAFPSGGTAMFALLALAGDIGCSAGPALVGQVSQLSGSLKTGILCAAVFPLLLYICVKVISVHEKKAMIKA